MDDSYRRIAFALLIVLYMCGALIFCIQVFVSPNKLSGLATVLPKNNVIQTPATTTGSKQFHINPNTIQSLHGMTEQQIRDRLGNEVNIQLQDRNGNMIQTTAKVGVQAANRNPNDVTVNFDTYDGVATYHCNTATTNTMANDVILLNAGRYLSPAYFNEATRGSIPKGQYREKVFLDLCMSGRGVVSSITALDVVNIQLERLILILLKLKGRNRIRRLPVAAMITPGESADTIVDLLTYGDNVKILRTQVAERWIPVSSESVLELDDGETMDDEITENASAALRNSALELFQGWPVLAIYGSSDILARQGAELLEREIGAKSIKLEGGADCHEQTSNEFGKAVMGYLSDQLKDSVQKTAATTATTNNGMQFALQFSTS